MISIKFHPIVLLKWAAKSKFDDHINSVKIFEEPRSFLAFFLRAKNILDFNVLVIWVISKPQFSFYDHLMIINTTNDVALASPIRF